MRASIIIDRIAIGREEDGFHSNAFKAALAEFMSTLVLVFAGQGSTVPTSLEAMSIRPSPLVATFLSSVAFLIHVPVSIPTISNGFKNSLDLSTNNIFSDVGHLADEFIDHIHK
ncbi:AQUAPORIN-8 [Salix purpurea]|uniref:AQUAPORIN-8 n=1 Tax=Salix purpurea TaxID=77065 RepID=A0A9Q1ABX6_SALPP|nr:AQUAPORIN-8 [Salix purpurea]